MSNNGKSEHYFFELLCIEPADIKNELALAQALSFSNSLWGGKTTKIENEKSRIRIKEETSGINILINSVDTTKVLTNYFECAFMLNIFSDNFDAIEAFRLKVLKHLKSILQFSSIRLLTDDVSTHIANKLYPEINKVENLLRKYLIKFFIQRIGSDWWDTTATKTMLEKARLRKADRRDEMTTYIDDEVRYIDFDDLGELIYKQSSGYNSPDKIVSRLLNMQNTDDFMTLKNELQSNYTKYFKENFQDKMFEQKWKEIIKLRNKVAHQGIFYKHELNFGLETLQSITEIISIAERKIDEIVFSIEDKEAIRIATIEATQNENQYGGIKILGKVDFNEINLAGYDNYNDIDEDDLIFALEDLQKSKWNKFIGLKWLVTDYLAKRNFAISTSFTLLNILIDKGMIDKYDVVTPNGYTILAIKVNENAMN
jgi:hypothetical protein